MTRQIWIAAALVMLAGCERTETLQAHKLTISGPSAEVQRVLASNEMKESGLVVEASPHGANEEAVITGQSAEDAQKIVQVAKVAMKARLSVKYSGASVKVPKD